MRRYPCVLLMLMLPLACAGCETLAATMAGGTMFAFGTYYVNGSAEETVKFTLAETEPVAHVTLKDFGLHILSATQTLEEHEVVKTDFRAGVIGDEYESVTISLYRVSARATRMRVIARKGWMRPDYPTAEAILNAMIKDLNPVTVARSGVR